MLKGGHRKKARNVFLEAPAEQTRVIIHTTIARILQEVDIDQVKDIINTFTPHLPKKCSIGHLWYVVETHELSNQGERTVIAFGGSGRQT